MKKQMLGLVVGGALVVGLALGGVGATLAGRASTGSGPAGSLGGRSQSAHSSSITTGTPCPGGMMGTPCPGGKKGTPCPGGMMGTPCPDGMMGHHGPGGMMGTPCPGDMMGHHGPGRMWSNCYPNGMMGGSSQSNPSDKTLTLAQAQQSVQRYVDQFGHPQLAIAQIMEFQRNFYAVVADKSTGHGAFEVLVNRATGAVFPEYGPAMMWNTTYGMMGSMMGYQQPSGPMTVSAAQATQIAQQWLAQHQPGATTEAPDQFPGYYTLHILKDGKVTGMLSVNGYSGQVWLHTWHGALIGMKDLHA